MTGDSETTPLTAPRPSAGRGSEDVISVFLDDIKDLKARISQLEEETMRLRASDQHRMANIDASALAVSMDEAQRLLDTAGGIRATLVRLYSEKLHWRQQAGSTEERLFSNMHTATSKRFLQVMETLHATFSHLKAMHKNNIERQLRLVNPSFSPEQVSQLSSSAGQADNVFAAALTDGNSTQYVAS